MIIVFVGAIGSGKTTGANLLKTHFHFEEIAFAEPIKQFAISLGFDFQNVYGSQEEKEKVNSHFGISGRQFMQTFGTDIMRNNSTCFPTIDNIWVKCAEIKIENALKLNKNVVISDCRFEDEMAMLKKYNAIFIKLTRPCDYHSQHISEQELNGFENCIIYENKNSVKDFQHFLEKIVNTKYDFYNFLKAAYHE